MTSSASSSGAVALLVSGHVSPTNRESRRACVSNVAVVDRTKVRESDTGRACTAMTLGPQLRSTGYTQVESE
jgi:hypothetical protein